MKKQTKKKRLNKTANMLVSELVKSAIQSGITDPRSIIEQVTDKKLQIKIAKYLETIVRSKTADMFVFEVIKSAIQSGIIDPRGKTDKELQNKITKYLKTIAKNKRDFHLVIDHRKSLLQCARDFAKEKEYQLCVVFYAIWVEHWLNNLIDIFVLRKRLTNETTKQIIRETPVRAKITWLLKIFEEKPILKRHQDMIMKIMEFRNAFIHYKWIGQKPDEEDIKENELIQLISDFEKTVKYLLQYENKQILYKSKRRIKGFINNQII